VSLFWPYYGSLKGFQSNPCRLAATKSADAFDVQGTVLHTKVSVRMTSVYWTWKPVNIIWYYSPLRARGSSLTLNNPPQNYIVIIISADILNKRGNRYAQVQVILFIRDYILGMTSWNIQFYCNNSDVTHPLCVA